MPEPEQPTLPPRYSLHFIKSQYFRSIHGAEMFCQMSGSGVVHLTAYTERPPIPRILEYELLETGQFGNELTDESQNKSGTICDVEVNLAFDLETAKELRDQIDRLLLLAEEDGLLDNIDNSEST